MKQRFQLFSLLLFITSCVQNNSLKKENKEINLIKYAQNIQIIEEGKVVKVHIFNSQSNKTLKYLLSKDKSVTDQKGYIRITIPIRSIITLSGTHIGMLSKINELDKIVGVSDKKYIYNPKILKKIASGSTIDFGGESSISFESIVKSKAQLLMYSGFGQEFPHSEQLMKLGTVCIPNYDWKENNPLGKAEWIMFFGFLTGKEKEATRYFEKIEKEYNSLKILSKKSSSSPTLFSGNLTGDIWYTPAGESFNAQLFKDANSNYLYKDSKGTGSLELSLEKVLVDNSATEFWLNPGQATLSQILSANPKMKYFNAVKNEKVFCYSSKTNLFWEMSAIEPHHVLSDMISILHPDLRLKKAMYFYQNTNK